MKKNYHLNYTSLRQIDANSLLSTAQDCAFDITTYDISNWYSGNQYIQPGHQVISIKVDSAWTDMALMYVHILEYTQWEINNITHIVITLDYPWNTDFTNDAS